MSKSLSPFTKEQLLPQEETLEIFKRKGELYIGIPKETAYQECHFMFCNKYWYHIRKLHSSFSIDMCLISKICKLSLNDSSKFPVPVFSKLTNFWNSRMWRYVKNMF